MIEVMIRTQFVDARVSVGEETRICDIVLCNSDVFKDDFRIVLDGGFVKDTNCTLAECGCSRKAAITVYQKPCGEGLEEADNDMRKFSCAIAKAYDGFSVLRIG